jgi:hypothetical protein
MSIAVGSAFERIIANTINETVRGDPDALAARIVAALAEAGYRIAPANRMEATSLGSQPNKYRMEQLYRSPNGDTWFVCSRSDDRLRHRQASSECVVRRSGNGHRNRHLPEWAAAASRTGSFTPRHWGLDCQSEGGRG